MTEDYRGAALERQDSVGIIILCAPESQKRPYRGNGYTHPRSLSRDQCGRHDRRRRVCGANGTFCSGANTRGWGESRTDPASDKGFAITSDVYSAFVSIMDLQSQPSQRFGVPQLVPTQPCPCDGPPDCRRGCKVGCRVSQDRCSPRGWVLFSHAPNRYAADCGRSRSVWTGDYGSRSRQAGTRLGGTAGCNGRAGAFELANAAARDVELIIRAKRSLNLELGPPPITLQAALEVEHGQQMWSQRRLANPQ